MPDPWRLLLAAAGVVAAALLLWTLVITVSTRALLVRAQNELDMAPEGADGAADAKRLLSFSVTVDPTQLGELGPAPHLPEMGLCACGDGPHRSTETQQGKYLRTAWMPLRHESGAIALADAVASGRVRYLLAAGAAVRVAVVAGGGRGPAGGHADHKKKTALLLMDLSSFKPPSGCRAVVPVAALPGAASSPASWADLLDVLSDPASAPAMHVLGF